MKSNRVLVVSSTNQPLMPCHPARARELLHRKKAAIIRRYPFTIILKERASGDVQEVILGIDPGSKYTGMSLVGMFKRGPRAIYGLHVKHRGDIIKLKLERRSQCRRRRRSKNLRYRPSRFSNRCRAKDWLPPSIKSRVKNALTWSLRFRNLVPLNKINFEVVSFDTNLLNDVNKQQLETKERIRGQMRHYLMTIYNNTCQYCNGSSDSGIMEWEHVVPKSKGGTDSLSNATLSCRTCNLLKGDKFLAEWLATLKGKKDKLSLSLIKGIPKVMRNKGGSLSRDASIVNRTRGAILCQLEKLGFNVSTYPSWETAYNRKLTKYPKKHWIDATCIGLTPYLNKDCIILSANARGWGNRQMQTMDKYGFPRSKTKGPSKVKGFMSGDLVSLNQPGGKYKGSYVGKVIIRTNGNFSIKHIKKEITSRYSNYILLQRNDGYAYIKGEGVVRVFIE